MKKRLPCIDMQRQTLIHERITVCEGRSNPRLQKKMSYKQY